MDLPVHNEQSEYEETLRQILLLKRHLQRYTKQNTQDQELKILHVFKKLRKLPLIIQHLQETEIGKVVNGYRKHSGEVGARAKSLILKWKALIPSETDRQTSKAEIEEPGLPGQKDPKTSVDDNVSSINKQESRILPKVSKQTYDTACDNDIAKDIKTSNKRIKGLVVNGQVENNVNIIDQASTIICHSKVDDSILNLEEMLNKKIEDRSHDYPNSTDTLKSFKAKKGMNLEKNYKSLSSKIDKFRIKMCPEFDIFDVVPEKLKKVMQPSIVSDEATSTNLNKSTNISLSSNRIENDNLHNVKSKANETLKSQKIQPANIFENDIVCKSTEDAKAFSSSQRIEPIKRLYGNSCRSRTNSGNDELISSKKNNKTLVYSGKKTVTLNSVPTLYNACIRVLMDNIDALDYVGGVPYDILEGVLQRCTPTQLYDIENSNPQFIAESDELWKKHCERDFKGHIRNEDICETWRELYLRKFDEREEKLKKVTHNLLMAKTTLQPVRKARLAYVDVPAKPPREVRRKQYLNNTATPTRNFPLPKVKQQQQQLSTVKTKKVAPLMKKLIQRYKR